MTVTAYNKHIHNLYICNRCSGKGKQIVGKLKIELKCKECMGIGVKVYLLRTQITDHSTARSIVVSYYQQKKKTEFPAPKFKPTITQQPTESPPYNPLKDPNHPLNPNNPFGWTHPFSPNNPFWKNNPANPNSINNPFNPANPNKPFK